LFATPNFRAGQRAHAKNLCGPLSREQFPDPKPLYLEKEPRRVKGNLSSSPKSAYADTRIGWIVQAFG